MIDCADVMLKRWAAWLDCRVRLLGYPSAAAFAKDGGRPTDARPSPMVDRLSGRVHAAVLRLLDEDAALASILVAHYLSFMTIDRKLALLRVGRRRYYEELERSQQLILRYVAEWKRNGP